MTACHGDTLIFNCSVHGGTSTVWKGSAFSCSSTNNEIILLHSRSNRTSRVNGTCDEGDMTAYAELENFNSTRDQYFSWLNMTVTAITVSTFTVSCFHDSGVSETLVSNWTVSVSAGVDSLICGVSTNTTSLEDPQRGIQLVKY